MAKPSKDKDRRAVVEEMRREQKRAEKRRTYTIIAACVVVANTGPAHLAAAVGTPVVSLFSPVVPAERWAPWGVPHVLLGDQGAACRLSRTRECPVPGHPCIASVSPREVTDAVRRLTGIPAVPVPAPATAVGGAR